MQKSVASSRIKMIPKVSFVIPCYNEEETIRWVIHRIQKLNLTDYEIIIVDDGSKDKSPEIVRSEHHTRLFVHKKNKGYGKTLLDGISYAKGELIVTCDSDAQHDPADFLNLYQPIMKNEADMIIGSRYTGKYYYKLPLVNRTGEALIEVLLRIIFGQKVKNNQGGFRVFNKKMKPLFKEMICMDMAFTTEVLMLASLHNFKVTEGPIHLKDRPVGTSRVKKFKLIRDLLNCTIYYILKRFNFTMKRFLF